MKFNRARELGHRAFRLYDNHDGYTERQANAVEMAITYHARDYLPDDALSAVIESEDGLPLILAATDCQLYVLNVESAGDECPATTQCRMLPLDPEACSVAVTVQYRGSRGITRNVAWRFEIGGLTLELKTRIDGDSERDEHGQLGQHLAACLGWSLPPSDRLVAAA